MKKYQYGVERKNCVYDFRRESPQEMKYIEEKSNDGWELVSVVAESPTGRHDLTITIYYWKREIIAEE